MTTTTAPSAFANFVAQSLARHDAAPPPSEIRRGIASRTDQVTDFLADGDKRYVEIAEVIGVSTSAIRQVIKVMSDKNLIVPGRDRDRCKTWRMA